MYLCFYSDGDVVCVMYLCFYSDGDVLPEGVDVEGCLPDHVLVQALTVHLQLNKQHQYLLKRQPRSNNTQPKKLSDWICIAIFNVIFQVKMCFSFFLHIYLQNFHYKYL